jgi:hypothetical protein
MAGLKGFRRDVPDTTMAWRSWSVSRQAETSRSLTDPAEQIRTTESGLSNASDFMREYLFDFRRTRNICFPAIMNGTGGLSNGRLPILVRIV